MLVTDIKRIVNGKEKIGYYMDGYLKKNLDGVPGFLKKEWDVVGIVSGHGKLGSGKSAMAQNVGYYLAWLLAGGKMVDEEYEKGKFRIKETIIKNRISINVNQAGNSNTLFFLRIRISQIK